MKKASYFKQEFPFGSRLVRRAGVGLAIVTWPLNIVLAVCLAVAILLHAGLAVGCGASDSRTDRSDSINHFHYQVVARFPHDRGAFTQGLAFYRGALYESTGLLGESSLRRIDLLTGQVVQTSPLPSNRFGEGLAVLDGRFVQLTWRSGEGLIYEPETLRHTGSFSFDGEGWGSTAIGTQLLVSDGSAVLKFLDAPDYPVVSVLAVTTDGEPVEGLNELELVNGLIYANIWPTDCVAQIDPRDGKVVGWLDLSGLFPPGQRPNELAVANGIAYDHVQERLFVTGKYWPYIYQIKVLETALDQHVAHQEQAVSPRQ
jgi:glutamine cyclotransferase